MSYTVKLRKVPKNFKKGIERYLGTLNLRETQSNESEIMYSDYNPDGFDKEVKHFGFPNY